VKTCGIFWRFVLCGCAGLLFCFALAPGAQQNQSTPQAHPPQLSGPLAEARSSLSRGDAEDAIQVLSSYLQARPEDSAARILLGQAYSIAGQNDRAEEEFQTVLQSAPDDSTALAALGEIYERGGQLEKAEPMLAHAAKVSHGAPQIRMEWGVVLARLHNYKEAQSALAGLSPPSGSEQRIAFFRLKASVALGLGNPADAAAEMEKALALNPADPRLVMAFFPARMILNPASFTSKRKWECMPISIKPLSCFTRRNWLPKTRWLFVNV
jgi:Tfp pilus assembly protein PilF